MDELSSEQRDLLVAIQREDLDRVRELLSGGLSADFLDRTDANNGPLHNAATIGSLDLVNLLLDHGARIDAQCSLGWTPLMRAANAGHYRVVKRLIEAGANQDLRNTDGYTAFMRIPGGRSDLETLFG